MTVESACRRKLARKVRILGAGALVGIGKSKQSQGRHGAERACGALLRTGRQIMLCHKGETLGERKQDLLHEFSSRIVP
jgi:hypothetical protein